MSDTGGIVVQRRVRSAADPSPAQLRAWARAARGEAAGEITVRVVDEAEMTALNGQFRQKPYATNVLSFPYAGDAPDAPILGDVVICAAVAAREAREQGKSLHAHWAHLVMHGVLHLLGHDHGHDAEAERMEALERSLLAGFGIADPYA